MLRAIVRWSLNNRVVTLFTAGVLLIGGAYAAITMPVDVFPDLSAPTVTVLTETRDMATEEVETLVSRPIEQSVHGATDVRRVRSNSTQGISVVYVEFDWGTDIFQARQIVNERLQEIRGDLPPDVDRPTLAPITSIMGEIMLVGVTSEAHSDREIRSAADWDIRPRLLGIDGVAQVVTHGGEVKEYQVQPNPDRMRAADVTLDEVLAAAEGANRNTSGGIYQENEEEVQIRGLGRTRDIETIGETVVSNQGATPTRLEDVATVEIGGKPRLGTGSVNAESAIIISIQKQPGVNTLALTEEVDAELGRIQQELPEGMVIDRGIFQQADFISLAVDNVIEALQYGALLVALILFLFLWNVRTTAISLVALPLSLAVTFLIMYAYGVTINTMTLGGLAIAIGALVDDAIIDVENAFQRLRENRAKPEEERDSIWQVVFESSMEVRRPILNTTIVIIVIFVPLFFLVGLEGRLLRPLGFAYIVAIIASLVVAVTVTPVLCYYLLPGAPTVQQTEDSWLVRGAKAAYRPLLDRALRYRRVVIGASGVLLVATLAAFPFLGTGFLPDFQEQTLTVNVAAPPGTGIDASDNLGRQVEERLLAHEAVTSTSRRTGRATMDEHVQGAHSGEIDVGLDLSNHTVPTIMDEAREALDGIHGANISIGQPISHRIDHMMAGAEAAIAIKVFGPELLQLRSVAEDIEGAIEDVEGLVDLNVEQQTHVPQLHIKSNRSAMNRYGVTPGRLADYIDAGLRGAVVSEVLDGEERYDLTVRLADAHRGSTESIRNLLVDTPAGPSVPLSTLADIERERGPNAISRENTRRVITVSANASGRDVGSVVEDAQERIDAAVEIPGDYFVQIGGQYERAQEATRTIVALSVLAILVVLVLLIQAFNSTRAAVLMLVNLPLALTGGVAILLLLGEPLNIAALVGFITLFGIAVRNGILLVDLYLRRLRSGDSLREAIVKGSMRRLNPILMTALTAALALVPLAMGGTTPGQEIQAPLAIVVLGGLLTSTALNMVVVPALFAQFGTRLGAAQESTG